MERGPQQEIHQISDEELLIRFGVSAEEAEQSIQFGSYSGTLGQMLADDRCPIGGQIEQEHQEHGIEGVREKISQLGALGMQGEVVIVDKSEDQYTQARTVLEQSDDQPTLVKKN